MGGGVYNAFVQAFCWWWMGGVVNHKKEHQRLLSNCTEEHSGSAVASRCHSKSTGCLLGAVCWQPRLRNQSCGAVIGRAIVVGVLLVT
jgi:hypothetical protein